MSDIAAAHDNALAAAGDDYEDNLEAQRRLNEAMGVCAAMGHWTSFYLLLADMKNFRNDEEQNDETEQ